MKAFYIDGKTAFKHECDVTLGKESLTIRFESKEGYVKERVWPKSKILKMDLISSNYTLRFGEFPHEVLEIQSKEDFQSILDKFHDADFHKSTYNKFSSFGIKGIVGSLIGVIIVSLFFFFYAVPFIAETAASKIPQEYEVFIGENVLYSFLEYSDVDSAKSAQLKRFYENLNYESEYDIQIFVVESPIMNAFALPGGFIVVFSEMIDRTENESELAALLAHEVTHVNEKHSIRAMSRDLSMYLLMASLTGDVGGFSSVIIENGNMINSMSYSRKFEKEADLLGFGQMTNSGIDPAGMVTLFEKFEASSGGESDDNVNEIQSDSTEIITEDSSDSWFSMRSEDFMEVLSTHPIPKNRIKYLNTELEKVEGSYFVQTNDSLQHYYNLLKGD